MEAFPIREPIELEAARTALLVFPLMTAPSELLAVVTVEFVFAFTSVTTEDDAFCTSVSVASEPDESPAPVSVLVPLFQTSAARVPNPVRVRVPDAHTAAGMPVTEVASTESVEPSDVEAVRTWRFVFALITAASDDDAVVTVPESVAICEFVLPFTAVASVLVPVFTSE